MNNAFILKISWAIIHSIILYIISINFYKSGKTTLLIIKFCLKKKNWWLYINTKHKIINLILVNIYNYTFESFIKILLYNVNI